MGVLRRDETELFTETVIACGQVATLCFDGDCLVDWASGHARIYANGTLERASYTSYGPRFDAAIAAPDGRHVAIYQRLGTKALLLRDGRLIRELNRSFYFADAYEYPITFLQLPTGRTAVVHCPDEYNRLEIDDASTGERLSVADRKPADFFHSRLAASPGGNRLLSAGWVWHPFDAITLFDIASSLDDPRRLDTVEGVPYGRPAQAEEASAAFVDDDHLLIAGSDETDDPDTESPGPTLRPRALAVVDLQSRKCVSSVPLSEPAGIMPVGSRLVLSLFKEPKLIEVATGAVLHRWEGLKTGMQTSSVIHHLEERLPPIALDQKLSRFAVATDNAVHIVQFKPSA